MTTFSVVIPAYNEEAGISNIVQRVLSIKDHLLKIGIQNLELVVVDDGSRDHTAQIASSIPEVKLIRHPMNRGYGAALKTGFTASCGDLIGFLDADGTYPPEYFPQLCVAALRGNDMVVGSRMAGADSQMPMTRWIGNLFFAYLLSFVGRQRVSDSASGMRVFKRELLEKFYPLPDGLNLTPVMSTRAMHEGIRMAEVPIPYSERVGRSKLSVVRDGMVFLQSILWTVLSYNPVRILGMLGLMGVLFAILVGFALAVGRIRGITSLGPWEVASLFAALVLGVTGVSIFSLGGTFNYLVSLFYKQPIRQGLFGKPLFKTSLDHHFGWMGSLMTALGLIIAVISFRLGANGWEIARLWLYLLGSALFILVGVQLTINWVLMRVLEELSHRESLIKKDFGEV